MKIGNAIRAICIAFKNMSLYPGLFMLLDKVGNRLSTDTADEIASIISKPMTGYDVDRVMIMINQYLDEPATA